MPQHLFNRQLITIVFSVMLMLLTMLPCPAQAQVGETTLDKRRQSNKPKSVRRPARASALRLEIRIFKRIDKNTKQECNPFANFHNGDQVQLGITPNQPGYLYLIHHSENLDGKLAYPDSRIDDGQNFIKKDREYIVPSYCNESQRLDDCWWTLTPSPNKKEYFTIIYSRKIMQDLLSKTVENGGIVKRQMIDELKSKLPAQDRDKLLRSPDGVSRANDYSLWITAKGDELIQTITIINQD